MSSLIRIANRALSRIGEPPILDLAEDTRRAREFEIHYEGTRDELLRTGLWNFATKRAQLAPLATGPVFGDFTYQFPLPNDFIRVFRIDPDWADYKVEDGNVLYDDSELDLKYIYRVTEVGRFDPIFESALVLKLAAVLAKVLTGNTELAVQLEAEASALIPAAMGIDAQEGTPDPIEADLWLDSRG